MAPRKTTDFGLLFDALVADLRIQVAASVDKTLSDFERRLARLEKIIERLDPENSLQKNLLPDRQCALCEEKMIARGLCSAHYQQWRYRERQVGRRKSDALGNLPSINANN